MPDAASSVAISLDPNRASVESIDRSLRDSLATSLDYLADLICDQHSPALAREMADRLSEGPVSPWVFALYAHLVALVSRKRMDDASRLFGDLTEAARLPSRPGIVVLGDPAISASRWEQYIDLLDTDRLRPFRPKPPSSEAVAKASAEIAAAMDLLREYDPSFHDDVDALIRMPVLAAPSSESPDDLFNGASSFFLWGAPVINAEARRGLISTIDLLVHESGHLLLFGLAEGRALTDNDPAKRYPSPLRSDDRPIDGIFHACFVASRVHLAITRLMERGLPAELRDGATRALERNGSAALDCLESLARFAIPTERGEAVLAGLRAYWADHDAD